MALPVTREAWRERYADGLTFADVEEVYQAGIMREERYLNLFREYTKAPDQFRAFWEPKTFPESPQ
ncbi:hypothetical protein N2U02_004488 [Salmonella enterica]|nr:hypothetical protein [Salmonella enterica]